MISQIVMLTKVSHKPVVSSVEALASWPLVKNLLIQSVSFDQWQDVGATMDASALKQNKDYNVQLHSVFLRRTI